MLFSKIADTFAALESTSSRLEMTDILARSFEGMDPSDLRNTIYLSQGMLHPDFYPEKLGMADRLILRAIAFTSGTPDSKVEELWLKEGDPGTVAEMLIGKKKQMTLFSEPLTFARVIKGLSQIETAEGNRGTRLFELGNHMDAITAEHLREVAHACRPLDICATKRAQFFKNVHGLVVSD